MIEERENKWGFVGVKRIDGRLSSDRVEMKQGMASSPPELEFVF